MSSSQPVSISRSRTNQTRDANQSRRQALNRPHAPRLEVLEERMLLAAGGPSPGTGPAPQPPNQPSMCAAMDVFVDHHVLFIEGTNSGDTAHVTRNNQGSPSTFDDTIEVEHCGQTQSFPLWTYVGVNGVGWVKLKEVQFIGEEGDDRLDMGGLPLGVRVFAEGGAGNDTLEGSDGDDKLVGDYQWNGNGNDVLYGRDGDDKLYGIGGNDTIYGELGKDTVVGGDGDDSVQGGDNADFIRGDDGNDSLVGLGGNDTIYGGNGNDTVSAGGGNDLVWGGTTQGGFDNGTGDVLNGDDGQDTIYGSDNDDVIEGGIGNHQDYLYGNAGHDIIKGGDGVDILRGGFGNDTIYGGNGDDYIYGDDGADALYGQAGTDHLFGGSDIYDPNDPGDQLNQ